MNEKAKKLCECAILISLSIVLTFVKVFKMPMGGEVTLASMLPVLFIGVKYGYKWGIGSALLFATFQIFQSLIQGDVFVWCYTWQTVLICILFDYVVPFGILGLSGYAKPKDNEVNRIKVIVTFSVLIFARFVCHFITGVFIWGQWAEGMNVFLYSLLYNGSYMLPELLITIIASVLILQSSQIRKLLIK